MTQGPVLPIIVNKVLLENSLFLHTTTAAFVLQRQSLVVGQSPDVLPKLENMYLAVGPLQKNFADFSSTSACMSFGRRGLEVIL